MLAATVNTLVPRLKLKYNKPKIENFVFQLHYKATVTLLLACVILVCAREFFGEHIRCISDEGVPNNVLQTYCFFMATFTIVRHYNESLLQHGALPHPGVGPILDSDETIVHTYYQWVPFVLFLQSLCFYLPHYIWKKKEGGRIKALVDGLQYARLAIEDEDMTVNGKTVPSKSSLQATLSRIRKDIILRLRISRTWSTWLVAMEVLNLVHVVLQIWLINKFLNGQFISLGPWVLNTSNWNQIADPLELVFPKVTKCVFHKYGPSGSIQQHDALCVMALNIIHEKIYVVLWFWLLFLFIASLLAVIWRIISYFLYGRSQRFNEMMFRQASGKKFNAYNIIGVVNGWQYADWLFLYYLAKNMAGFVFQELFVRLAEELDNQNISTSSDPDFEKKEAVPVLVAQMIYDDTTLPVREEKKSPEQELLLTIDYDEEKTPVSDEEELKKSL